MNTLRRQMEEDMERMNNNWIELEKKAQERVGWRVLLGSLCSIRKKNIIRLLYEMENQNSMNHSNFQSYLKYLLFNYGSDVCQLMINNICNQSKCIFIVLFFNTAIN
ncbi:unnamed protein product [Schistosoma margrebowiei]|uniref:Uncharacterized protein n=1 Tax=Schistosoma margrebowiei TaxID=48269 RepID=A0A183M161_9TREM|nr:unnamed protein product [Schistosoma margrebowiei]